MIRKQHTCIDDLALVWARDQIYNKYSDISDIRRQYPEPRFLSDLSGEPARQTKEMSKTLTIMSVAEIVNQGTNYQIITVSDTNPTNQPYLEWRNRRKPRS